MTATGGGARASQALPWMRALRLLRVLRALTDVGFLAYWAVTLPHVLPVVTRAWAATASPARTPPTT